MLAGPPPDSSPHPSGSTIRQNFDQVSPNFTDSLGRNIEVEKRQSGFFNGAGHVAIHNSSMIEYHDNIVNNVALKKTARERLAPHTNLDAAMDSLARSPPPRCRTGTRKQIVARLISWLTDPKRHSNMLWVHGSTGTGKSAIAQTFAEYCSEKRHPNASFFFSQLGGRDNPDHVIPTLVYQLAEFTPKYQALLADLLSEDPEWMRKTRRTQFKKFIIEPFQLLQVKEPIVIILDGLDQCMGGEAQHEIIEMIDEAVRQGKSHPFLWLICSRPEAHLAHVLSASDCTREELAIDAGSRSDVEAYLRDGLTRIKKEFSITTTWPSEDQIAKLLLAACGLFAFASAALDYIGDSDHGDPTARLDAFLSFLQKGSKAGSNPLKALDLLYTRIFDGVPSEILPTSKQILSFPIYALGSPLRTFAQISAQALCNFLRLEQGAFYAALRKLHSVVDVPPPEAASQKILHLYHNSFQQFLQDAGRSGNFFIDEPNTIIDYTKLCLSWYESDVALFQSPDGLDLKWASDDNKEDISLQIASLADKWNEGLISQIQTFDFKHVRINKYDHLWCDCVNWLWKTENDTSSGIVRTEPRNKVDHRLLEYMKIMSKDCEPIEPAVFPLKFTPGSHARGYFLVGRGSKSIMCLFSAFRKRFRLEVLRCDKEPSERRIQAYRSRMRKVGWYQEVVAMKDSRVREDVK